MFIPIFIFNSFFSFSQCKEETRDDLYTNLLYVGCLDDQGLPNGKGILTLKEESKKIFYDGNFKEGKFNGEGTLFLSDGSKIWGSFEEDEFIYGNFYSKKDGIIEEYIGGFKGDQFNYQGNGKLTITDTNEPQENTIIQILKEDSGRFINNRLANGISKVILSDGTEIISKIRFNLETLEPEIVSEIRNDRNYYNIKDIEGDTEFSLINLIKRGDENEGISYSIPMKVSGVSSSIEGEWIFDTGAESFSIGRRMYERMKEEGMQFKKLNMDVQSVGVGGISNGELIVIDEITIGDYKVKNVVTKVNLDHDYSLLGMWFLIKFSNVNWSMKNNTLKLYK